jgi:hypothetical protein
MRILSIDIDFDIKRCMASDVSRENPAKALAPIKKECLSNK